MVSSENTSDASKKFDELNFGYTSAVGFFLCTVIGYWADQKWHTGFRFTLFGIFLGSCSIAFELWKIIQKLNDPKKKKK